MSSALEQTTAASRTRLVEAPADLVAIYDDDVNLCIWRRPPSLPIHAYVVAALARRDTQVKQMLDPRHFVLDDFAPDEGDAAGRQAFLDDLELLVELYADLIGARGIGMRLVATGTPTCPRFHFDRVGLRLICTYAGPGTEILCGRDQTSERIGRFAIAFLKGDDWPGNLGRAIVHRSPPLAPGERRVFVTLDAL
jgi:Protein of unknown function (DUF1826)